MKKWSNGARKRLVEIQAAEDGRDNMQAMAAAFAKLPPGQLKKVLADEIVAILEKYGVALYEN